MTLITFVAHDGVETDINVAPGASVMEAAVQNGVSGIIGECGGVCACATCHVYFDPEAFARVGAPGETEAGMLEFSAGPRPTSRLSCQIKVTEALDGLVVHMPESQH
jgi:2Fe-2S ferredoxin